MRRPIARTLGLLVALGLACAGPAGAHSLDVQLVPNGSSVNEVRAAYAEALATLSASSRFGAYGRLAAEGGNISDNVEYIGSRPEESGQLANGGKLVDGYFYMSGSKHISIYDVAKPEDPQLVSRIEFPVPRFENEDVTTNGKILLYSDFATTQSLYVYDVTDKRNPKQIAELPGAGRHTMTCVRDCQFAYGSYTVAGPAGPNTGGEVVDLRDPANPKVVGDWSNNGVLESRKVHDVLEVAPGRVLTASAPMRLLDIDASIVEPKVIATAENPERLHNVVWPRQGKDRFIITGFETNATPDCSESGEVKTFDATAWKETGRFEQLSSFQLKNGTGADGNPPANTGLGCSPHWFEPRPDFENGGVIAMGSYDHGLRFLRVDGQGQIEEIGRFRADETQASAAYWITDDIVYVVDYTRGLDIVRFKEPARPRDGDTTGPTGPAPQPAGPSPEAPAPTSPAPGPGPGPEPAGCVSDAGFASVGVRPADGGARLVFKLRDGAEPADVDVFQTSRGRRVVQERLVARFSDRAGSVKWDGEANRPGRRMTDGYYFVRFRTRTAAGQRDTRRVTLRRKDGRLSVRRGFYRREACDLVRSFKLRRPVFGGAGRRTALDIAYRLSDGARVTVTVRRGTKVVKRFVDRPSPGGRTVRLRVPLRGLRRGEYTVRLEARRGASRVVSTLVSRRL